MRIAWLVLAGCGAAPAVPTPVPTTMVVLDPGAEPREVLRYVPRPGSEQMEMTLKRRSSTSTTNTALESGHEDVDAPTIKITYRMSASSGGKIAGEVIDVAVLDDVVDPKVREAAVASAEKLKGATTSWHVAPNGFVDHFQMSDATFDESNFDTDVRFPEVAIGVGAKWHITERRKVAGIQWDIKRTFTLRAFDHTTAWIDFEGTLNAPEQAVRVDPSASVKLTRGVAHVMSQVKMPLQGIVVTTRSRTTTSLDLRIVRGDLRTTSTIEQESLIATKPLSP